MPPPISEIVLDHVAVAVPSVEAARARWVDELGGVYMWGGDNGGFQAHDVRYKNGAKLELLQPSAGLDGNDFVTKFLEKRGAWVHHITFKVASLTDALDRVADHGLGAVDVDLSHPFWKEAFLRPSQVGRIVIQLAESQEHGHWHEAEPGTPPSWGAAFVGPLLHVESPEWADRLYRGLLGGTPEVDDAGRTVYRWPESPLVITVDAGEPGAHGLLVDDWERELPADPSFGPPVLRRR